MADCGEEIWRQTRRLSRERAARQEEQLRGLLEQWVSGLSPAVAMDKWGEIMGLCDADAPLGSRPYIFRGRSDG